MELNLLDRAYLAVKIKAYQFFHNEDGDVNIVSIVVLIGIVVILAVVFKDQLYKLIKGLFATITGTADKAVTENAKDPT